MSSGRWSWGRGIRRPRGGRRIRCRRARFRRARGSAGRISHRWRHSRHMDQTVAEHDRRASRTAARSAAAVGRRPARALRHLARRRARGRGRELARLSGRDGRAGRRIGLRQIGVGARGHAAARQARGPRRRAGASCSRAATCSTLSEDEMRAIRGRDIAMIFQEPMTSLNPVLTDRPADHGAAAHPPGDDARTQARARAIELLRMVGIPDARAPARPVSAPVLGRHAPARDDRDRARVQSRSSSSPTSRPPRSTSRSRRRSCSS